MHLTNKNEEPQTQRTKHFDLRSRRDKYTREGSLVQTLALKRHTLAEKYSHARDFEYRPGRKGHKLLKPKSKSVNNQNHKRFSSFNSSNWALSLFSLYQREH